MNNIRKESINCAARAAVLYARVSTGRQAERDLSIPDQLHQLRSYCKEKGIEIAEEFRDAKTGRNMDRPGLNAAREFISNSHGQAQYLLIHSFSRIARDTLDYELMKRDFEKEGVEIVSISQQVGNSAEGELYRKIINAFDEHQSHETAKHVSRSMKENARQGFWNGGISPFGFRARAAGTRADKPKKKLEIDPVEAEDVRLIYRLYLEGDGKVGGMGIAKIAKWLNKYGHSRRGSHWTTGLVHRVLSDRIYIGKREYKRDSGDKEKIIISVPVIVDDASFQRAQEVLRRHNPLTVAPRTVHSPILLTGIACCNICGGGMILQTGKGGKYRYYRCSNHIRKGKAVCSGQSVPMRALDDTVMEYVADIVLKNNRAAQLLKQISDRLDDWESKVSSRVAGLEKELQQCESSVARLYEGVAKGIFDLNDDLFLSMLNKARGDCDIIEAQLKRLLEHNRRGFGPSNSQFDKFSYFLRKEVLSGSVAFRRAYLRAFVEKIELDGDNIRIIPKATA